MSAYEQRIEPPDKSWQYLLFAAEPYETIAFKVMLTLAHILLYGHGQLLTLVLSRILTSCDSLGVFYQDIHLYSDIPKLENPKPLTKSRSSDASRSKARRVGEVWGWTISHNLKACKWWQSILQK